MEVNVNDANFQAEVLKSDMPVLVDFWADWCGPCRMIAPIVGEVAKEFEGKIKVCKVNVEEAAATSAEYGVISIPTLAIFKGGKVVDKAVGAVPKGNLVAMIKKYI